MKIFPSAFAAIVTGVLVFIVQEIRLQSLRDQIVSASHTTRPDHQSKRAGSSGAGGQDANTSQISRSNPRKVSSPKSRTPRSMTEVMQSEEGRTLIKEGIKTGLPTIYGDFIDSMALSEDESQYFEELLTKRLLNQQQTIFKWMQSGRDDRQKIEREMAAKRDQNTREIEQLLQNERDAAAFRKYEQQLPERQQMPKIRSALSTEQLEPAVEEELIEILYQARLHSGKGNGSDEENWLALSSGTDFSTIEDRWKATDAQIAQSIPDLLTPSQTEKFLTQWKISRKQKTAEYQMGILMFGLEKK
ncbi:MAG: hypothetical protein P1U90_02700 [Akkermansiaceae bacterium]|nr:hypothetical protein [Akkermansiaceae bacterium]